MDIVSKSTDEVTWTNIKKKRCFLFKHIFTDFGEAGKGGTEGEREEGREGRGRKEGTMGERVGERGREGRERKTSMQEKNMISCPPYTP